MPRSRKAASPSGSESIFTAWHNSTVLMVDDDPTTLEFVKKFLERAGYTRWVATTNSREALSLIAREQPDIVLLDLIMPGVNGFEILAGIRGSETARYTPVIVLTAETNPDAQLRALELGATDFLTKPVNPAELRLRVRNALAFKAWRLGGRGNVRTDLQTTFHADLFARQDAPQPDRVWRAHGEYGR